MNLWYWCGLLFLPHLIPFYSLETDSFMAVERPMFQQGIFQGIESIILHA